MYKLLAIISILLFSMQLDAQEGDTNPVRAIADEILKNGQAYENLRFLCKQVGPRLSGSPQAAKAVQETARMLREAGADTVYLQSCMVPHWVRGDKEVGTAFINGKQQSFKVCALGMSVGTGGKGIKAPIVEVANFDELHALGDKVKGKIVFYNYPMRPELVHGGYGDAVKYRGAGPVEAAKLGAVGVVVRSVTHALDYNPHTGATRYADSVTKIPAMACSTMDAEWLHNQLKNGGKAEFYMRMTCEQLPDVESFNVIGEIRGSEHPEEIITAGGHLDSWDLAEGAHDDGTGCVQAIEMIRAIKALGWQPKRTIRAVMFMNEENGTRGGRAYAEAAKTKGENHIFAAESDEGGFGVQTLGLSGDAAKVNKIRTWLPLFRPFDIYDMPDGGGGADIGPLAPLGTVLCGVNPESQRYFDHHHTPIDVFEAVNKRELEMGAIGMTGIVWLVAEEGL